MATSKNYPGIDKVLVDVDHMKKVIDQLKGGSLKFSWDKPPIRIQDLLPEKPPVAAEPVTVEPTPEEVEQFWTTAKRFLT